MNKDVLICHAREDKTAVVHPLVFALKEAGITYWLDEEEIALGESITAGVNEGFKISDYVVVIFSRAFLLKNWPQRELWAAMNIEAETGVVKVIPILVGSNADIPYIRRGIHLRRDTWVSVRYAEALNSTKSSVTLQSTDRHDILGQKRPAFHVSL
jgi:hypothetical protein